MAKKLCDKTLGPKNIPVAYIGDTIADIQTVINARKIIPDQKFISIAVAPPHLHLKRSLKEREIYESKLKTAGADLVLNSTNDIKRNLFNLFYQD